MLVIKSENALQGARQGIEICIMTVIPSLLPIMAVTSYIAQSDAMSFPSKLLEKLTRFLFSLPSRSGVIFLLSMTGGYPVGPRLISESIKNGTLTKNQGKRMLLFCVNPGPAFVVNAVGLCMLKSKKAGLIILLSLYGASFLTGLISKLFENSSEQIEMHNQSYKKSSLSDSASKSVSAVLNICGWVIFFSSLMSIINGLPLPSNSRSLFSMLIEVTLGCGECAKNFPLYLISFVLGWSGLAVHCQLMPYISSSGLKYMHFLVGRVFNATVSMGIAYVLFKIFPCEVSVFSNAGEIVPHAVSVSVPATAGMLFLSALVILDLAPKRKV